MFGAKALKELRHVCKKQPLLQLAMHNLPGNVAAFASAESVGEMRGAGTACVLSLIALSAFVRAGGGSACLRCLAWQDRRRGEQDLSLDVQGVCIAVA